MSNYPNEKDNKSKRPRVYIACDRCRQRKIRCDGGEPSCGQCSKRNVPCVFGKRVAKALISVDYVKSLEEKLGLLTDSNGNSVMQQNKVNSGTITSSFHNNLPNENRELPNGNQQNTPYLNNQNGIPDNLAHILQNNGNGFENLMENNHLGSEVNAQLQPSLSYIPLLLNNQDVNTPTDMAKTRSYSYNSISSPAHSKKGSDKDDDSATDAMGAGSVSSRNNLGPAYYGSSAAISFMKELFAVVDNGAHSLDVDDNHKPHKYSMCRNDNQGNIRSLEDMDVPPRRVADRYIKNYFDFAYTLYPFVHKPTFIAAYEEIWSVNDPTYQGNDVDELFYSILNIIFAFGCRLSPDGEENFQNANLYFERSQELLRFHLMDPGSVLLVQALLLTGQFLQATTRLAGCWNIIGLAIRIAQGLGLHLEQNLVFTKSHIEKEMRKRLWHGCLLMDRIVSMTLGRPMMVTQDSGMELPLGIDDVYISDDLITVPNTPSVISFFLETVKLYHILADILQTFYSNNEPDSPNLFLSMFKFEERLNLFHENIPDHIKCGTSLNGVIFQRQSIVLQIRYLHLKIMLYRPILFPKKRQLNQKENSELYSNTQKSISSLCVEAAKELINLITKYRSADINSLPASWYIVFYIYTAETVLLAAKLHPSIQNTINSADLETTWLKGLDLLVSYANQSDSSSRCLKVLQMMDEKVKAATSRLQKQQTQQTSVIPGSANSNRSNVSPDVLYSLLYDTTGPFGGPFSYWDDLERHLN